MSIPTDDAPWATSANYPAGAEPEAGTPTKVAVTTDQDQYGWRPDQIPPAQEENDWRNKVGLWTTYLKSIHEPKWVWLPAGAGQNANSPATAGTFLPQGYFGEVAQTNYISVGVPLPAGARILKVGMRFRHTAGEGAGGVIGSLWLNRLDAPANGVNAANPPTLIPSDPPQAVNPTVNTIEFVGNSAAGAKWETITVDVDQTGDLTVASGQASFVLVGGASGVGEIESVGYQYQLDS